MFKKDYLQRKLESLGKALAMLKQLRNSKDYNPYHREFASVFITFTSLLPEQIESMDQKSFEAEITRESVYGSEQKHLLADLLFEKLHYYLENENHEQAKKLIEKCSFLYHLLQEDLTENEFHLEIYYRLSFLNGLKE